jgi:predicted RND superfamily exporter protein
MKKVCATYIGCLRSPIARWAIILFWVLGAVAGVVWGLGGFFGSTTLTFNPTAGTPSEAAGDALAAAFPNATAGEVILVYVETLDGSAVVQTGNNTRGCYEKDASSGAYEPSRLLHLVRDLNSTIYSYSDPQLIESFVSFCSIADLLPGLKLAQPYIQGAASSLLSSGNNATYMLINAKTPGDVLSTTAADMNQMREATANISLFAQWLNAQIPNLEAEYPGVSIRLTGLPMFGIDVLAGVESQLISSEAIAFPVALVVLSVMLRSLRLLIIPILCILSSLLLSFLIMWPVALCYNVIQFCPSVMSSVTLALSIDYSLFLLSRFREEAQSRHNLHSTDVVVNMMTYAGHTVLVSGCTICLCFLALLFFPIEMLASVGIGSGICIAITITCNCTLTPAILLTFYPFFADFHGFGLACCCCRKWCIRREEHAASNKAALRTRLDTLVKHAANTNTTRGAVDVTRLVRVPTSDSYASPSSTLEETLLESGSSSSSGGGRGGGQGSVSAGRLHDEDPDGQGQAPSERSSSSSDANLLRQNNSFETNDGDNDAELDYNTTSCWYNLGRCTVRLKWLVIAIMACTVVPFVYFVPQLVLLHDFSLVAPRGSNSSTAYQDLVDTFGASKLFASELLVVPTDGTSVMSEAFFRRSSEYVGNLSKAMPGTKIFGPSYVCVSSNSSTSTSTSSTSDVISGDDGDVNGLLLALASAASSSSSSDNAAAAALAPLSSFLVGSSSLSSCAVPFWLVSFAVNETERVLAQYELNGTFPSPYAEILNATNITLPTAYAVLDMLLNRVFYGQYVNANATAMTFTVNIPDGIDAFSAQGGVWIEGMRSAIATLQTPTGQAADEVDDLYLCKGDTITHDAINQVLLFFPRIVAGTLAAVFVLVALAFRSLFVPLRSVITISMTLAWVYGFAIMTYQVCVRVCVCGWVGGCACGCACVSAVGGVC